MKAKALTKIVVGLQLITKNEGDHYTASKSQLREDHSPHVLEIIQFRIASCSMS
jgi:hypothetical protein